MTQQYAKFSSLASKFANYADSSTELHIRRGLEKESLRISTNGRLAQTPHPRALGAALTHSRITTDFAEPLLEFITPVESDVENLLSDLEEVQSFTYANLDDELLWVCSMPCILEGNERIPVARYGSSNVARMKTIYRIGLGHRYGRLMQTIAGIHYNFSLSDDFWLWLQQQDPEDCSLQEFKTRRYFGLIRNFYRYCWLPVYLFGASPAICETFVDKRPHSLTPLTKGTLHLPFGTTIRMSELGYQSSAQAGLDISYNCLDEYLQALEQAIKTPHPQYQKIGVRSENGYRQLNDSLLQIENEFYSSIRPKRVAASGESPRRALRARGVEYIEIRCIDLNPYEPLGIDRQTVAFFDCFLLFCLLQESPPSDHKGRLSARQNLQRVVNEGRRPQLTLDLDGREKGLSEWGQELLTAISDLAIVLEQQMGLRGYRESILAQRDKLRDAALTPSARIIEDLTREQQPFFQFALQQAKSQASYFAQKPLSDERMAFFRSLSERSIAQQVEMEHADTLSFEQYLEKYFEQ